VIGTWLYFRFDDGFFVAVSMRVQWTTGVRLRFMSDALCPPPLTPLARHHAQTAFNFLAVHFADYYRCGALSHRLSIPIQVASRRIMDSRRYLFQLGPIVRRCVCIDRRLRSGKTLRMMPVTALEPTPTDP
jgi:hypothetical protein